MLLKAIQNRRSVRFFRNEEVTDEKINEILSAGFMAPSAHNAAPWHVVVVREQSIKDEFATIHKWSRILAKAPVVIAMCIDRSEHDHFWLENGAAFLENMVVQAAELELGTCWIGIQGLDDGERNAEDIVRKACGLPGHFGIVALMALGVAARYPGPHEPKIPDGRVHWDRYNFSK